VVESRSGWFKQVILEDRSHMHILVTLFVLVLSYLLGSIPFGLVIVRLRTGKDIRQVESGRTGGTNAMRAAGLWAGLSTTVLDAFKAAATVWLARSLDPTNFWLHVFAPIMAILGHNYSIFLLEKNASGRFRLRGGAGGAPAAGGAMGLWFPSILIILPFAALMLFGVGYASIATMSAALIAALVFGYRAVALGTPWQYFFYGLLAEALLVWALRPNIRRLIAGNERVVGWRARQIKKRQEQAHSSSSSSS
jgi:acyl phosphate:glycerol-3-phosphate acyltransferase